MLSVTSSAGPMGQTWIDICQKAKTDPRELVEKYVDKLLKLVLQSTTVNAKVRSHHYFAILQTLKLIVARFPRRELSNSDYVDFYCAYRDSSSHHGPTQRRPGSLESTLFD
jgi:hypothetical protein